MNKLQAIKNLDLLNWQTVSIGFNCGWLEGDDVIQFAVEWLVQYPNERAEEIILIAGAGLSDLHEIKGWLGVILSKLIIKDDKVGLDQ